MACVSPDGPVYQAGTLSGNPVAMAAGIAQLTECAKPGFYEDQEERTNYFVGIINDHAKSKGYNFELVSIGSIFWLSFNGKKRIHTAEEINPDMSGFKKMHKELLNRGIYLGPSGYEVGFVSKAHSKEILTYSAQIFCEVLDVVFAD
jgi:glutamate-1-semialdehyde 2,1-aminomutase